MLYRNLCKPLFDFVFALLAVVVSLPVFLIIALLLFCTNKGHVMFCQQRIGKSHKPFTIYKFYSLRYSSSGIALGTEQDFVFPLGQFLRRAHLDELPQLINILLFQMSFIGPRPLLPHYLPMYSAKQLSRHDVRPGLLGLAQCFGGNSLSWSRRLSFDSLYAKRISFRLDCFIIARSIRAIYSAPPQPSFSPPLSQKARFDADDPE